MAYTDSLISYWALDEASGTRNDSHGTNHLADNNTVLSASGMADFEETNHEYLSIADNASLSCADIDFSFAAWINAESFRLTGGDANSILAKGTDSSTGEYYLVVNSAGEFEIQIWTAGFSAGTIRPASTFGALSTSTPYFVVAWHDSVANTLNIQVNDGAVDTTSGLATACHDAGGIFTIGGGYPHSPVTQEFDGLIGRVMFAKRVWTSDERTYFYNSGAGRSYAEILAGPEPEIDSVYKIRQVQPPMVWR